MEINKWNNLFKREFKTKVYQNLKCIKIQEHKISKTTHKINKFQVTQKLI